MAFLLKKYDVTVSGFPTHTYDAASLGHARSLAWQSYCSYRAVSFRDFLKMSSARRSTSTPDGYGRRILVSGKPAYFVSDTGQYIRFVRDHETQVLSSHPLDVQEVS